MECGQGEVKECCWTVVEGPLRTEERGQSGIEVDVTEAGFNRADCVEVASMLAMCTLRILFL
jgi:hypothetical protein